MGSIRARVIQFVSRSLPAAEPHGGGTYVLDLFRYLREKGFKIEYTLLTSLPLDNDRRYELPRKVSQVASLSAPGHTHWGRMYFTPPASAAGWPTLLWRLSFRHQPAFVRSLHRLWQRLRRKETGAASEPETETVTGFDDLPTVMERSFFKAEYNRIRPAVVIADYAFMAPMLDDVPVGEALKVVLTYDVLHQRVTNFARHGIDSGHAPWTEATERALLCKAQVLLAIQDEEAAVLQAMVPEAEVICVPFAVRQRQAAGPQVPGRCLFVGSRGPHNVHGLHWFLEGSWLEVLRLAPEANMHVCGSVCDQFSGDYPSVQWLGRMDDLAAEYGQAEVCLVPLPVGSGLKIKLVEALAFGRAAVSTSAGLQGLRQLAGRAVAVADSPSDFASRVAVLLKDSGRRRQMEHEARSLAAELSPERCYQPLVDRIVLGGAVARMVGQETV